MEMRGAKLEQQLVSFVEEIDHVIERQIKYVHISICQPVHRNKRTISTELKC